MIPILAAGTAAAGAVWSTSRVDSGAEDRHATTDGEQRLREIMRDGQPLDSLGWRAFNELASRA